jgi:alkylation response protein AidB-like acyl-CoA dehydrogenase
LARYEASAGTSGGSRRNGADTGDSNSATDYEAFRAEVRAFLEEKLTLERREQNSRQAGSFAEPDLAMWWHRSLYDRGWVAPAWPKEYGGAGWDPLQRHIFESECAAAGAPSLPVLGLQMCGPMLMKFGSQRQKEFFLPKILSGEHYWCQGYSEPQAGSDLAALRTAAVRDGDHYVVNGSKIWTTHAHFANWIFVLVRTSTDGKKQEASRSCSLQ